MDSTSYYEVSDGPSVVESIFLALASVRYTDLPIICLIAFLVFWYWAFFHFRNSVTMITVMFFLSIVGVFFTENLNSYFGENWTKFGFSRNYFDPECVFAFTLWALPLSILSIIITLSFFIDLCKSIATHRFFRSFIPETPKSSSEAKDGKKE